MKNQIVIDCMNEEDADLLFNAFKKHKTIGINGKTFSDSKIANMAFLSEDRKIMLTHLKPEPLPENIRL